MMRAALSAVALAAASLALTAVPLRAQDPTAFEYRAVTGRSVEALDPTKAYLLVEAPGMILSTWLVMPDEAQRAEWERQRQAALAEAVAAFPGRLVSYKRDHETWANSRGRRRAEPEQPIEPSNENFAWPELESRRMFTIGPQNRIASESEYSLWLYEVPAGEIIFRGLGMGAFGDCACLGTLAFATQPGKVTAVRIAYAPLDSEGRRIDRFPGGSNSLDISTRSGVIIEPPSDYALDPRIPREMITVPEFRLVEAIPNWFGQTVNRVQPYPGLFSYDGTRMVDLRRGAQAPVVEALEEAAQESAAE
ncbi:hypothetical protein [Alteraurantiacibacter buctensis]|uniref:Uncharacterized protein n=1 Tax=Alteraurantiacibacter buctensis TaxID=1503981 RepID=A0A844Z0E2_9SPHN|nr:hypothetical protein [Alteraurantiacibacter buctensis]MXO72726.1 hypothetical protein [Alteraurantiacibacter buctensis]